MKISIIGSGSWGTALAFALSKNEHNVSLHFLRKPHIQELIADDELRFMPGVKLPPALNLVDSLDGAADAELLVLSPPSYAMRENAQLLRGVAKRNAVIVSASKGIERESGLRLSQVIEQELGGLERIAVLSGPSHAEEVAKEVPTGLVAASLNRETAQTAQDAFMNSFLRVYTSDDVVGVELCGALKNVVAISVGISDGLGYGDNTKAMLMTRGLTEMSRLGERMGGKRETFSGLAGVGDLFVTCTSRYSRNRRAGLNIGGGMDVKSAMDAIGQVVEGYYAAAAAVELAGHNNVELPISAALFNVLYNGVDPRKTTAELMDRPKRGE
jgi:glycerol-3-phosphate dehydrogenase (NAD(P)+)